MVRGLTADTAAIAARVTEFWLLVDTQGDDECWPWNGYQEEGYGQFYLAGRMYGAHELALTLATGERRDPSLDTCHRCGNSICCNPSHLRFGTRSSNVQDSIAHGTFRAGGQKLTKADADVIRTRLAAGARGKDLAAEFGVTPSQISQIKTGRRWAA